MCVALLVTLCWPNLYQPTMLGGLYPTKWATLLEVTEQAGTMALISGRSNLFLAYAQLNCWHRSGCTPEVLISLDTLSGSFLLEHIAVPANVHRKYSMNASTLLWYGCRWLWIDQSHFALTMSLTRMILSTFQNPNICQLQSFQGEPDRMLIINSRMSFTGKETRCLRPYLDPQTYVRS